MKNRKKRVFSLVLCLGIVLTLGGCGNQPSMSASSSVETATYEYHYRDLAEPVYIEAAEQFAAGSGTVEDPYQISSAQELAYMSNLVNEPEEGREYRKAHYKLIADIVLNEGDANAWSNEEPQYSWNPIGVQSYYNFEGTFDGAGYTVSGLYINTDCRKNETGDRYGLFGNSGGTIKNVNIANSYICVSGLSKEIGAIVGDNRSSGVVSSCTSSAIIECYDATCGGVVGANHGVVESTVFAGTINELRDYSYNSLGGVVGASYGKVLNCTNEGQINSGIAAADVVGGIVGRLGDGTVTNCTNNGIINCAMGEVPDDVDQDVSGARVGGIVGCAFSSKTGGEYANKDILITTCVNNGEVLGGKAVAGIVSDANNNGSNYSVRIVDCTNSGKVANANNVAGIVALATCTGAELTVSGCRNTVDIADEQGGGIICDLTPRKGTVKILNCVNSGNISARNLYAGGIISRAYLFGDMESKTLIEGCSNTGKISTPITGGGIVGDVNGSGVVTVSPETAFKINKCTNTGEIYTQSSNAFIGGIVGGFGAKGISSEITNCVNSGSLSVEDVAPSAETIENDKVMNLARMCGGIVGRIGDTLYLSTSYDYGNASNVNAEDALLKISECYSSGTFNVPAEDKYKNHEGKNIWDNHLGGIVGNCSAADGYSFLVENCGYANIDRGLGTREYPDVGMKMLPEEIQAIMNRA